MKKFRVLSLVLAVVLCCALLTGCMGVISEAKINQDGSGSIKVSVGYTKETLDMMAASNGQEKVDLEGSESFVYNGVTYYGAVEEGEFASIEELNNILNGDQPAEAEQADFNSSATVLQNADGTFDLKIVFVEQPEEETDESTETDPAVEAMAEEMMAQMAVVYSFEFPSPVRQTFGGTEGVTIDVNKLTIDLMKNGEETAGEMVYEFTTADANQDPSEWARTDIIKASEYGLLVGWGNGEFQTPINREDFANLIVNCVTNLTGTTVEKIVGENIPAFDDTHNIFVNAASKLGIVNGVGDNKFAPELKITRQEIAVMMHRAIKYVETAKGRTYVTDSSDLQGFEDAGSVADWAAEAVGALAKSNIMRGTSETTLSPLDNTTTEQAIVLAVRIFEMMK